MNTRASGASAKHSGFSAHAVERNTTAATTTATHAGRSVTRPDRSSRAPVRGFLASGRGDTSAPTRVRAAVRWGGAVVDYAAESVVADTFVPIHWGHGIKIARIEELFET